MRSKLENFFERGVKAAESGKFIEALDLFEVAIDLGQYESAAGFFHEILQEKMKMNKQAIASYKEALSLDTENVDMLKKYGFLLIKHRRWSESVASFDKALTFDQYDNEIWLGHGYSLIRLNKYPEALTSFDRVCAINPKNAYAWFIRGTLLYKQKRHAEAIDSIKEGKNARDIKLRSLPETLPETKTHIKKNPEVIAICRNCGNEFLRDKKNYKRKYCSDECANEKRPKISCQKILKNHHENLITDPNRLSTEFIADLVGCECKTVLHNKERDDKKKRDNFVIDYSLLEY